MTLKIIDQVRKTLEGITNAEILTDSRKEDLINARAIMAWQLTSGGMGMNETGRIMHRTHSTIIHSVRKMNDVIANPRINPSLWKMYNQYQNAYESATD